MTDRIGVNIASHLPVMARENPYLLAAVYPQGRDSLGRVSYTHYTLEQLNRESDAITYGLENCGIKRGVRTAFMATPSLDFFALVFALFKVGAVPVLIDPGIGVKNMGKCLKETQPTGFIGITKAHVARLVLGWAKKTVKIKVTVGPRLFWGGFTLEGLRKCGAGKVYQMADTQKEETAAILFTSGSTGTPKGAVYTHGIFDEQVKALKKIYDIKPGEIDLATFPLFALFGPALGMGAIIPDMDAAHPVNADPFKLIQSIKDFGATNMFCSPALINKLGRYGEQHQIKLPSLKRVISAGAPANPQSLERFSQMLKKDVRIYTPYGATESLPICSIGSEEILRETGKLTDEGKGTCVGFPAPDITLRIIKIIDGPIEQWCDDLELPPQEIGEIIVQGPVVSRKYFNRDQATEIAKIMDPANDSFYHRMGDVGYLDQKGRVWFCGRKAHRVITSQGTLFTIPCEAVFNVHPYVFRTALVGIKNKGEVEPVLCVELEKTAQNLCKKILIEEILALGEKHSHTAGIKKVLFHPSFPVDIRHNAKIFREKLTIWAEKQS